MNLFSKSVAVCPKVEQIEFNKIRLKIVICNALIFIFHPIKIVAVENGKIFVAHNANCGDESRKHCSYRR